MARTDEHRAKVDAIAANSLNLEPRDRAWLARFLLNSLEDIDFTYGNFEAAKAVQSHVKAARRELKGLSL